MTWPMKKLGEVLEYEQPGKYIVSSTDYSNEYRTPVLTAGQTFILGYTNEKENIFPIDKLPVIIFDDFTTAIKFVDFPFKVKSSAMKILHAVNGKADAKFLFYAMQTTKLNNNTHKRYWISEYSNIEIPLPPLEIQKKIVKKIEELFAKITQAQSLRESAIQETSNLIPATLSKILEEGKKKGWDINTLANICLTFTDGDWIESKDQSSDGIRLVQTGNIGNGGFLNKADRSRFISVATFERLGCTEIFPNDLLISRLPNPVGRSCLIPETGQRMITAVDCTIVRIDTKGANQKYVMYFTNSSDYFEQVSRLISGTTRDRISRKNLGTIKIPLPPLAEQKKIVEKMDALTQKVRELQKLQSETAANLTALKQSILHKAFQGELIN